MKKASSLAKKYWWAIAVFAFVLGVGGISAAVGRAKQIASDPKNAVTK